MIKKIFDDLAESFGSSAREAVEQFGSIAIFFWRLIRVSPQLISRHHILVEQLMRVGVRSLPLICLTSVFVGLITVWQAKYFFQDVIPYSILGMVVSKAILTDLGPVLTALVITGRIGAMLAAELGTMKVTEQVDAMVVLSLDPYLYLLAPRVLSGFIMMPVLGIFSSFLAIVSAQLLATAALDVSPAMFYNGVKSLFDVQDVIVMMTKTLVFGGSIAIAGCYYGFLTWGGAVAVGRSTNRAVVAASVLILVSNLIVMGAFS